MIAGREWSAVRGEVVGARPAGEVREAARGAAGGRALRRAGDQLARQPPGQAHAALRGVHRLRDREAVRPQVVAEAEGGLPVDQVAAVDRGDVGGGVDAARGGRRVAGRPAGRGDLQRLRPAGQRDAGGHVRLPARVSRRGGPRRRTASRARPAGRPWRRRTGPSANGSAARGGPQEQLPLRLEPVAEVHVVRHVGPHRLVVERVGQVGVPHRHRGGHLVLHGAVAQARHRAAVRAVHLQLEQLAAVDADRPRGVHRRDDAAGELEHRVGRVVGGHVVGLARLVPPPGQVRRAPRVDRADRAEQVLKQVLPVREHVEDDAAAVFRAVVPRGALRREPVAFEHPVAELEPDGKHPAEEALADQPAQLDHAGQEQLVLHDAVRDARRPRRLGQGEGGGGRGGHRLFRVDVLARRDGAGAPRSPGRW